MVHWAAEKVSTLLRGSGLLSNFLFIKMCPERQGHHDTTYEPWPHLKTMFLYSSVY